MINLSHTHTLSARAKSEELELHKSPTLQQRKQSSNKHNTILVLLEAPKQQQQKQEEERYISLQNLRSEEESNDVVAGKRSSNGDSEGRGGHSDPYDT